MIKSSQSDVGSFVRSAAYELKMGYLDLKQDLGRQLCWDGTGTLATVNTAANASTTLVISGRTSAEQALKFVDSGLSFDLVRSGAVVASNITINSISSGTPSSSTATVILDTPITASVNDTLIRTGSLNQEVQGLFYALDGGTGTIYNVDRSTALAFQGNVSDVSSAQSPILSIDAMQSPYNSGLQRGNVASYNAAYTGFASLRYYQKLLTPDKRYSNTREGDGTFGDKGKFYLDFNGIACVPDQNMPERFAFLPSQVLKMYELCAMEFADETGSMMIAQSDADTFEVRVRHFTNLFNEQPAACGVLTGYTSP